ncbi:polynucleotide adenylyltransferase PcnB [Pasteurella multocida]|uniref:polynucleotide adenylyltransferase PcnB n=1 Tax=Pasteurella multocida TaxID=747 RepID=UPI000E9E0759|nr:polynucleotide adenylyltransferase PcnB [Pasteurella multocida]MDY0487370.1 polynucleotide adenylyltransferase PcnB [Pasteurella multocida]MDY0595002.1 polynucleotide adenylyltransferase PcnB [Pasteurella multocida]MDY0631402.1 polynucleotide adenylyltransferase PcnB [Pasteurella multocida]MDY0664309.1 polynucleotide adenylyltransferase PcnB [Pasteurella multocida]MDY0666514.1 polynucleotide adenylyltransferase PcnB [Pasteurella multocida]
MRSTILKYIKNLFNKKTKAYLVEREKTDSTPLLSKNAHSEPITTREIRNVSNSKQAKLSHHYNKSIFKASQYGITPRMINRNALGIVEKLHRHGFEAYIVGGCLRDLLLGKHPKDFDVATNALPEQIQTIFQRQCRLVGRRFRLAHIMFGRDVIEVATFRASHNENNHESLAKQSKEGMLLRDNVYGTLEQDAERRDFTVNALYYNLQDNTLRDYFHGIEDLKAGKLRLIGDPVKRYQEDPVRMLRSVRFMAKLDMFLEKPSEQPIRELAPLLKNIPPARLFDECLKLLQAGYGVKTYKLLRQYGLFEQLFPSLMPYFTEKGDSLAERMILKALTSTDERVADKLRINPAFLFAAFFWYPLREKVEMLKNEGGLNNHDAYALASSEILDLFCAALAAPRRHTAVIRDIWFLQLQLLKRSGQQPVRTMEHPKFRAAFDLLAMRSEVEGGETIELATWWHEYQFSNSEQRDHLVKEQQRLHPKPKKKYYRARKRRKPKAISSS